MTTPKEFGLNFDKYRPGQRNAIISAKDSHFRFFGVQAPTGLGKSFIPKALAYPDLRTIVLTQTKLLQESNYRDDLGFFALMGRNNYSCPELSVNNINFAADSCIHNKKADECPSFNICDFELAKSEAKVVNELSMNYSLYLLMKSMRKRKHNLVCDEAHLLPGIIEDFVSIKIEQKHITKYNLPAIRFIISSETDFEKSVALTCNWMEKSLDRLTSDYKNLHQQIKSGKANHQVLNQFRGVKNLMFKIESALGMLQSSPDSFYIRSFFVNNGFVFKELIIKPLTAKFHTKKLMFDNGDLYDDADKVVLMSATLNPIIMDELGIDADEYDFHDVPSIWKPEEMPILWPDGLPKVNAGLFKYNKEAQKNRQLWADIVGKLINEHPKNWGGIVHFNSYDRCESMVEHLQHVVSQKVVSMPRGLNTNQQYSWWINVRKKSPSTLLLVPTFSEGVNLPDDQINIMGDMPYWKLDELGMLKMKRNVPYFQYMAAAKGEQRMGRNRRGDDSHYGEKAEKLNIWGVPNWGRAKKYFNKEFVKRIVKV